MTQLISSQVTHAEIEDQDAVQLYVSLTCGISASSSFFLCRQVADFFEDVADDDIFGAQRSQLQLISQIDLGDGLSGDDDDIDFDLDLTLDDLDT